MASLQQSQYAAETAQRFTAFKVGFWCITILHQWVITFLGSAQWRLH